MSQTFKASSSFLREIFPGPFYYIVDCPRVRHSIAPVENYCVAILHHKPKNSGITYFTPLTENTGTNVSHKTTNIRHSYEHSCNFNSSAANELMEPLSSNYSAHAKRAGNRLGRFSVVASYLIHPI